MKKRLIAGIISLCIVGNIGFIPESISPAVALAESTETATFGTCGENLTWSLDSEGTLTISGTGDMNDEIPWNFEIESIKKVIIQNGVTNIGDGEFSRYQSLTSITIPDSVTSIRYCAFYGCTSLESITILNPECEIYDSEEAIDSGSVIKGYNNSTAQAYAEKYNRTFESLCEAPTPEYSLSDLNGDKFIDADDATLILSYYAKVSTESTQSFEDFLKK